MNNNWNNNDYQSQNNGYNSQLLNYNSTNNFLPVNQNNNNYAQNSVPLNQQKMYSLLELRLQKENEDLKKQLHAASSVTTKNSLQTNKKGYQAAATGFGWRPFFCKESGRLRREFDDVRRVRISFATRTHFLPFLQFLVQEMGNQVRAAIEVRGLHDALFSAEEEEGGWLSYFR